MGKDLSAQQQKAVYYFARGESTSAVARALKVSLPTVRKWHRLDDVQKAVQAKREAMIGELAGVALERLRALLAPEIPPAVQLKAACEVLDRAGFSGKRAPNTEAFTINIDLSERPSIKESIVVQPEGPDLPPDSDTFEEE